MKRNILYRLNRDKNFFKELKTEANKEFLKKKFEKSLNYIYLASTIAWKIHFGVWYDDNLDNLLYEIGTLTRKTDLTPNLDSKHSELKLAFIITTWEQQGGLSEIVKNWINLLEPRLKNQFVYITQYIDPSLNEFIAQKRIKIFSVSNIKNRIKKIFLLSNQIQKDRPDLIFLFIYPNDVVAISSLTFLSKKSLCYFINHSDHTFWLGKKIINYLIEFRTEGAVYSRYFREINVPQFLIPLSTNIKPIKYSKSSFNIPENSTVSVSIANFWKIKPNSRFNYFKTIEVILRKFPQHYHLLITSPKSSIIDIKKLLPKHPSIKKRFIIDGPYNDLQPIYGIADFLIETFPFIGGMVRIEAIASGLPIVAFYNKAYPLTSISNTLPKNYQFLAINESDIINFSSKLIKSNELRRKIGAQLYCHYKKNFDKKVISNLLNRLIDGKLKENELLDINTYHNYILKYNTLYAYKFLYRIPIFKNFLLIDLNQSLLNFKLKLRIYCKALKKKEFKNFREIILFSFLILPGKFLYVTKKLISIILRPLSILNVLNNSIQKKLHL